MQYVIILDRAITALDCSNESNISAKPSVFVQHVEFHLIHSHILMVALILIAILTDVVMSVTISIENVNANLRLYSMGVLKNYVENKVL